MSSEISSIVLGTLQGLIASTVFLLVLFIGFLVIAGFTKIRTRGRDSTVVHSLAERMGSGAQYLPPDAPRGPADQLRTPELLQQSGRGQ